MTFTDQAFNATCIERDYYREQYELLVKQRDETQLKHEAELAEAHQLVAAMSAEIRRAA